MDSFNQKRSLKNQIDKLIALRQEGGYWDFKRQWHNNKHDLLHDIICMSNNLENRDAFIIIGVDEGNDYSVVDTQNDVNRRNTQKIVDFLRDKKFAGGIRPVVHVEPLQMSGKTIDVIVIENSHSTPFFLIEPFESVRANHIYTRVMDTNTPIDKTADIDKIEYLWRKHFFLDTTPMEKFCYHLSDPSDWERIQDVDMGYFCKSAPEFTFTCEYDRNRNGYEYYIFGQIDTTPSWWRIILKYHQTTIGQYLGIALDGGRCFAVAPHRAYELSDSGISNVAYFVSNELRTRLLEFFHQKESTEEYAFESYMKAILEFESEDEHDLFFEYAIQNTDLFRNLCAQQGDDDLPPFPEKKGLIMNEYKKEYRDALVLKKMLMIFRNTPTASLVFEENDI